jgi:hypothetical protein
MFGASQVKTTSLGQPEEAILPPEPGFIFRPSVPLLDSRLTIASFLFRARLLVRRYIDFDGHVHRGWVESAQDE